VVGVERLAQPPRQRPAIERLQVEDPLPLRRIDHALDLLIAHDWAQVHESPRERSDRYPVDQDPILIG
jgi:hypothetical protein